MKKIVFLGAKDIGFECLKILYDNSKNLDYNIIAVLTNKRGQKIKDYCYKNDLLLLDNLDEYLKLDEVDIAISVQYHKILKKIHIDKAREITVNLHMAPLPEYRGCNQFSFAILDGMNIFGTTIHRIEDGIDSGAIIFERRFPIPENIWVYELYQKTYKESIILFKETLPLLISGEYELKDQSNFYDRRKPVLHYRKEIEDIKKIDLNWPKERIERHIRATYMPGFKPPYAIINNKKVNFVIDEFL